MNMKVNIISFISGLIFALGLGISGMTQPQKVVGFLDVFGHWDPSLIMVMVGAILFHGLAWQFIKKKKSPLFSSQFHLPTNRDLDSKLFLGAALFGLGWGLGGFCPGPALTSVTTFAQETMVFVFFMFLGMGAFRLTQLVGKK